MASGSRSRALVRRSVGAAARRLGRPELFGAVYPIARRAEDDAVAMRAILAAVLREGSCYVDVGANRGQLLREAVRLAAGGRHVAFEPIPELAAELAVAFPQVDCRALALGARSGHASFWHYTRLDGWSGLERNPEISDAEGAPVRIEVEISTLDEQLGELEPALVKIDVEGAEVGVLEGARGLLARARPLLLFEHVGTVAELYGASSAALWDLLAQAGYTVFTASGEGPYGALEFASARGIVNWLARPASV
jgi:FkbM family methyltransferase